MNSMANLDSFFRVCKRYVMMIILPELTSKLYDYKDIKQQILSDEKPEAHGPQCSPEYTAMAN